MSSDHVENIEPDAPLEGGYYDSEEAPAERPQRAGPIRVLDEYVIADIVEHLQRGVYFHVAAEAAGVEVELARQWLAQGKGAKASGLPAVFAGKVIRAKARARAEAESRVWIAKPQTWLRQGPGRDRGKANRPGWTNAVKVSGEIQHTGEIRHRPVTLDLSQYSEAELLQLEALTSRALPAAPDPDVIDVLPTDGE